MVLAFKALNSCMRQLNCNPKKYVIQGNENMHSAKDQLWSIKYNDI